MKKRLLAALLTVAMVASFGACGAKKEEATTGEATEETVDSDVAYIQEKGTLLLWIIRMTMATGLVLMLIWRKRLPSHLA